MKLIDDLKKALQFKSLLDKIRKSTADGFSWKLAAKKFLTNLGIFCFAMIVASLAEYFGAHLDVLFAWLPADIHADASKLLGPIFAAAFLSAKNWANNRKNEIVWVEPAHIESEDKIIVLDGKQPLIPISVDPKKLTPKD